MHIYNLLTLPIYFIYIFSSTVFFTNLLNLNASKKSKIFYVFLIGFTTFVSYIFIKKIYIYAIYFIFTIFITKITFKTTFLKSLISQFFIKFLYLLIFKCIFSIWKFSFNLVWIPILIASILYFVLYLIIKHYNFNINFDNISRKFKIFIEIVLIIGFLEMIFQFYFVISKQSTDILITLFSAYDLFAYSLILIYSIFSTNKFESTSKKLETSELYNSSLNEVNNKIRGFKHDFNNIIQGIGGYIACKDFDGLENYYNQILSDCNSVNNLSTLNPNFINNPAIYSIVVRCYNKSIENGIKMNITCLADLKDIYKYVKIYELSKILGILLDNAREAANEYTNKFINLTFKNEIERNRLLIIVENSCLDKKLSLDNIFEKSFSTKSKKTNSGFGLWEVRQILQKNNNLNLHTTNIKNIFTQQLEIYY